jgi:hypothetical protein
MIESLTNSKSRSLALFAACTFNIGFYVGMTVQLFIKPHATSNSHVLADWGRDFLEKNAGAAARSVAFVCVSLCLLSFFVLSLAYISEAHGSDQGVVRFSARALYLLSLIGLISAISTALFFIVCHL